MKKTVFLMILVVILFTMISCGKANVKEPYYFFIYNSEKITDKDVSAIQEIKEWYTDYEIVIIDANGFADAIELYGFLKSEAHSRKADPSGIQIFGTPFSVPTFNINYEIEVYNESGESEISLYDDFVSDYFYTNFQNDPNDLEKTSAYKLSKSLDNINIIPDWPVIRLPLSRGQYSNFFAKYKDYQSNVSGENQVNISIASPIFPIGWYSVAIDDTGCFLKRAKDEWGILNNLKLYGTTEGVYPSPLMLDGSCETENWAHLTKSSICEIFHDGHAGENVLSQTIFYEPAKDKYHCKPILETKTINQILDGNKYLLNTYGCEPAKNMSSNIITAALRGRCVGAIASTTLISNVDVDCQLTQDDYDTGYTKYTFLYEYLLGRKNGITRSAAFYNGQHQVASSLLDIRESIHPHTLQTSLNNLLGMHNFGIIDP